MLGKEEGGWGRCEVREEWGGEVRRWGEEG